MRTATRCLVFLLAFASHSCGGARDRAAPVDEPATTGLAAVEPAAVPTALAWRTLVSREGNYTVQWRALPEPIPSNESFELEVKLFRGTSELAPLSGARLYVSGWMPEHGHGMLRGPRATDNGDGSYRVRGMLLHMSGRWQIFFDLVDGASSERAECEVVLP
jgi:hypothetical protein